MLGVSGLLGSSSDGAAAAEAQEPAGGVGVEGEVGGGGGAAGGGAGPSGTGGGFSEEEKGRVEEADRSAAGNRWPRQETLALLKIRSDMDVAFRDSSLKGPLWEEVSRKLAELGYHRSAKKCKEKFENVYKYHKRTREGRASKSDGKTYRFFDQLEALDSHPSLLSLPQPKPHLPAAPAVAAITTTMPLPLPMATATATATTTTTTTTTMGGVGMAQGVTVPSTTTPIIVSGNSGATATATSNTTIPPNPPPPAVVMNPYQTAAVAAGLPSFQHNFSANFMSNSTSSATSSDDEPERRRKRKRRWEDFFERLMKEVIRKQEELQRKFLETLEKRERDRMVREEAWRVQEMARLNREHELLVHERSIAAAKDAAVIAFLQKVSEQNPNIPPLQMQMQMQVQETQPQPPPPPPPLQPQPQPQILQQPPLPPPPPQKTDNGGDNFNFNTPPSSSRWPKSEVQELIRLRTNLDLKYQENGPKGPLWEEISSAMRKLGYNRSSKRCKEKWENINKYFKKVKESNKKRPEDSKTCPYFQQLDALYKEKNKADPPLLIKPESTMAPIMVRPEQQWPLPPEEDEPGTATAAEDHESENMDQNHDDEDVDEEEEEEEDDEAGGYEIVTNKQSSVDNVE